VINLLDSLHLSWKEWLLIYMTPGIAVFGYNLAKTYKVRPSEFARAILENVRGKTTIKEVLENILVYSFAGVCILIGWPAFLVWWFITSKQEATQEIEQNKPRFYCMPQHLIQKLTPMEAEASSYVIDPLGKVPNLPFGHLNTAWAILLSDLFDPKDELWSFHIPKGCITGKYGNTYSGDTSGFAKIRNGEILAEFITEGS